MWAVPSDKRKPDRRPATPENCDENKENIPMNKRLLSLLLALALVLSLTACGSKKEEEKEPEKPQVEEPAEQPEEDETEIVDISEVEPEETEPAQPENLPADPTEKPEANAKPADPAQKPESKPVEKPSAPVEKPAEKPAQKPAEDAQSKPAPSVDLTAFYESAFSGDNVPAMMQAEGEVLDAFYPGLTAIKTNQCAVYTAMISAVVGEIALVEVQNSADVQAVKDIFQARVNYQVGDDQNPGGAWYPQSIEGWKNGSRIVSNGNYVMLIALSEGGDDVVNSFNALFA